MLRTTDSSNEAATDYTDATRQNSTTMSNTLALPSINATETRSLSWSRKKNSQESVDCESSELSRSAVNAAAYSSTNGDAGERSDSESAKRSKSQKFAHKVLKMNVNRITQDKIQAEALAKALQEQEQKERQRVVSILMDHGVTAAQSRAVSKRASDVESRSSRSISAVREMIDDYEHEVEGFKSRIAVM